MNLYTSLKDEICRYAALNDINKVILFGSRARGTWLPEKQSNNP